MAMRITTDGARVTAVTESIVSFDEETGHPDARYTARFTLPIGRAQYLRLQRAKFKGQALRLEIEDLQADLFDPPASEEPPTGNGARMVRDPADGRELEVTV